MYSNVQTLNLLLNNCYLHKNVLIVLLFVTCTIWIKPLRYSRVYKYKDKISPTNINLYNCKYLNIITRDSLLIALFMNMYCYFVLLSP